MSLAVGLAGGSSELILDDVGGLTSRLRDALAIAGDLDPERVAFTLVQQTFVLENGTEQVGSSIAINGSSAVNSGTLAGAYNNSILWGPSPSNTAAPRLRALQADDRCATTRAVAPPSTNRTRVRIMLDLTGLTFVAGGGNSSAALAFLDDFEEELPAAAANFTVEWSACTGASPNVSEAFSVVERPVLVEGPRPVFITSTLSQATGQSALPPSAVAATTVIVIFGTLACCCFGAVLCLRWGRRSRERDGQRDPETKMAHTSPADEVVASIRNFRASGRAQLAAPASAPATV